MVKKEYLYFEEMSLTKIRKTGIFSVKLKSNNEDLGLIAWNNGWRQYCFFPDDMTHYSAGCLKQVYNFIDKLMEERKNGKTGN